MASRILVIAAVTLIGVLIGSLVPQASLAVRSVIAMLPLPSAWQAGASSRHAIESHPHKHEGEHKHGHDKPNAPEGTIKITAERIEAAKIETGDVGRAVLLHHITAPATVTTDPNRIARIAAKVVGTVSELNKQLGDQVSRDEVVAVLESREVADAKSDYISATVNLELQRTLFEREQSLAQSRVIAENQFLRTKNVFAEAQLRSALAKQKLSALKIGETEIAQLSMQTTDLRRYELRSPIAGRVVERLVDLGAPVGREGQASEIYVVADLSAVWVELAVPTVDLAAIKEGQRVTIATTSPEKAAEAKIVFISPILNAETRSARVIASLENKDLAFRPGTYVTARVAVAEQEVSISVPRSSLQMIGGEQIVFVRTAEGFERREVVLGKSDSSTVEVVFGLDAGEKIATTNTFVLKAELGKAEAEHVH